MTAPAARSQIDLSSLLGILRRVRGFWQEAGNPHIGGMCILYSLTKGRRYRRVVPRETRPHGQISRCSPGSSPTRWSGSSAPGATASVSSHGALGACQGRGTAAINGRQSFASSGWTKRRQEIPLQPEIRLDQLFMPDGRRVSESQPIPTSLQGVLLRVAGLSPPANAPMNFCASATF
jgi:hypothetical protein